MNAGEARKAHNSVLESQATAGCTLFGFEEMVAQVIKEGGSVEEALQRPLPALFDGWLASEMVRFERNIWSSYKRLSGK